MEGPRNLSLNCRKPSKIVFEKEPFIIQPFPRDVFRFPLDFTFDDYEAEPEKSEVVHTIKLKNQNGKTFCDKLTCFYLGMPNFTKTETELETRLDKWLYFIRHLEDFQSLPTIFKDEAFTQAFQKAEPVKPGPAELDSYEAGLKIYRALKGVIDTAFDEGRKAEKTEVAKKRKEKGLSAEDMSEVTGPDKSEFESL